MGEPINIETAPGVVLPVNQARGVAGKLWAGRWVSNDQLATQFPYWVTIPLRQSSFVSPQSVTDLYTVAAADFDRMIVGNAANAPDALVEFYGEQGDDALQDSAQPLWAFSAGNSTERRNPYWVCPFVLPARARLRVKVIHAANLPNAFLVLNAVQVHKAEKIKWIV